MSEQAAKDYAIKLLSYRERTCKEIKDRLVKKGFDNPTIERVINHLLDINYLNDKRFARLWIKDRIKNKPRGRILIQHELKKKGIADKDIDILLNDLYLEKDEKTICVKLSKKWLNSHDIKEIDLNIEPTFLLKLKKYLANKGFPLWLINNVIDELSRVN